MLYTSLILNIKAEIRKRITYLFDHHKQYQQYFFMFFCDNLIQSCESKNSIQNLNRFIDLKNGRMEFD